MYCVLFTFKLDNKCLKWKYNLRMRDLCREIIHYCYIQIEFYIIQKNPEFDEFNLYLLRKNNYWLFFSEIVAPELCLKLYIISHPVSYFSIQSGRWTDNNVYLFLIGNDVVCLQWFQLICSWTIFCMRTYFDEWNPNGHLFQPNK